MIIEPAVKVLNRLERDGVIDRYAMGGAFATLFYMEPTLTYDLDVFVFTKPEASPLAPLSAIYEYVRENGYKIEREHVLIEGVPVQFIPAYNDLVVEAITEAIEVKVGRVSTRVLRVEHLAAIMLQTGRKKDRERLALLCEEATIDKARLEDIVVRHGLRRQYQAFLTP